MKRILLTVGLCFFIQNVPLLGQQAPATQPAKPQVHTQESQAAMTPSAALEQLKEGNARFSSNVTKKRDWSAKVLATAAGQFPFAAILACMDSRAPVESSSIRVWATRSVSGSPETSSMTTSSAASPTVMSETERRRSESTPQCVPRRGSRRSSANWCVHNRFGA